MDFSRIKDHRLAVLEQACERYAIMAFETLNGRLAIGLKSIQYSYYDEDPMDTKGTFRALFLPRSISNDPDKKDRAVGVAWDVEALLSGRWRLSNGLVKVQNEPDGRQVEWSEDGVCMAFRHKDHIAYSLGAKKYWLRVESESVTI